MFRVVFGSSVWSGLELGEVKYKMVRGFELEGECWEWGE